MLKAIAALEDLIKENEELLKQAQDKIRKHESGEEKLSPIILNSAQNTVEEATKNLEIYKKQLEELQSKNLEELEKMEKIQEEAKKRLYYKFQKERIKKKKELPSDTKLEALMIIDELGDEVKIEDDLLLTIAIKSIKMQYGTLVDIEKKLDEIKTEFKNGLSKIEEPNINSIIEIDDFIPILVLQFHVLVEVLNSHSKENNFHGLPKYEDWWISEFFITHQAYFALFKLKEIIKSYCISDEEKEDWEIIFAKWLFVKQVLHSKGERGFEYNYIFDSLLAKYAGFEEETEINNIESLDKIVQDATKKTDFVSIPSNHKIFTPYLKFKLAKKENG